jgi:hypothetical protein
MPDTAVNLLEKFNLFNELWSRRVVIKLTAGPDRWS